LAVRLISVDYHGLHFEDPMANPSGISPRPIASRDRHQFSLRYIFLFITLLCVYFGWQASRSRIQLRMLADQVVDNILVEKHWEGLETDSQFQPIVSSLAAELSADAPYRFGFLRGNGSFKDGATADSFEQKFARDVSGVTRGNGKSSPETAERGWLGLGPFRYYRAIRARKSCVRCHRVVDNNPTLAVGGLIAIVKVELDK
jgi:hypothetical protein